MVLSLSLEFQQAFENIEENRFEVDAVARDALIEWHTWFVCSTTNSKRLQMFTADNTAGFDRSGIDLMNEALAHAMGEMSKEDYFYSQYKQTCSEKIARRYQGDGTDTIQTLTS